MLIMAKSIAAEKSFNFAKKIVVLCKKLVQDRFNYVLTNQILKSGTSIGANIAEAQKGQSFADFLAKNYIALKEAAETAYWLRLLHETGELDDTVFKELHTDCNELISILTAICKSRFVDKDNKKLKCKKGKDSDVASLIPQPSTLKLSDDTR